MKFQILLYLLLLHPDSFYSQESVKKIDSINNLPFDYKIANTSKIIKLTLQNVEKAKKIKYGKGIGEAYFSLGTLFYYQGKYDKNTFFMLEAIRLFEKQNDVFSLIKIYGEYGYQLKRRNMVQASRYMNTAIRLGKKNLNETELNAIYDNYGVLKEMQSDLDSALYFYTKALRLKEKTRDKTGIPYSLNKIAMLEILRKHYKEAKLLLDKAYTMRLQLKDRIGIAENLNFYGHYYQDIGKPDEAVRYFNEALTVSKAYDYKNLTQENYLALSQLYEEKGDFTQSLKYYKEHIACKDSIHNLDLRTRQAELDAEYETEKKEKEILLQRAVLAEKNFAILIIGTLLTLSLLGGFFVYKRQKIKNRQLLRENDLREALQLVETQNKLQHQRLSISRDLHDNIGSQLTFIISSVDNLKYRFSIDNDGLKRNLSDISLFTRNTITELRDTIWAMNKDRISFLDLKTRIANFIENAQAASLGIRFHFDIGENSKDDAVFTSLQGINLYRIIQESVNNSIKYSEATEIRVEIFKEEDKINISISDNGKGFDTNAVVLGNGLYNMQKRMAEVGGHITIVSEVNNGTTVKAVL